MAKDPRVWLIRASNGQWTDAFAENGYIGIRYNLDGSDMSEVKSMDEVREIYNRENPEQIDTLAMRMRSAQVGKFLLDIKQGDFVLTPGTGGEYVRYGRISSDNTYYVEEDDGLPCRNRRSVDWEPRKLTKSEFPSGILSIQGTVREIRNDSSKSEFLKLIGEETSKITYQPEDSWVPFHLEVGRKLIEGEWWREEKRDVFEKMIDDIRWADPWEPPEEYEYTRWPGDPFSFYLSFNMRSAGNMRVSAFEKVKELMDVESDVPSHEADAWGLAVSNGWKYPLDDEELKFLWEFFRLACELDPLSDQADFEAKFVESFDKTVSESYLRGIRIGAVSTFLYWIDPTKYIPTGRLQQAELLDALGFSPGIRTAEEYLEALKRLDELGDEHGFTILDVSRYSTTGEMFVFDPADIEPTLTTYNIEDALDEGLFFERDELAKILARFKDKKNLILQGPPGVGKTFVSERLAYALMGERADDRIRNVQFHQSYSYEEFVQGYRPGTNKDRQLIFVQQSGAFLRLCKEARERPHDRFVMIIDEINRGNLSRVFGELLSLIEKDKRGDEFSVELLGGRKFSVPENVYILGTMNLADRSLSGMDYAMRRRFAFATLKPMFRKAVFEHWLGARGVPPHIIRRINDRMSALNKVINQDTSLGRNFAVGHSYFCDFPINELLRVAIFDRSSDWDIWYRNIIETEIQPLLEEYWFDAVEKADDEVRKLLSEL